MDSWKQYIFSIVVCVFSCKIVSQIIFDPKRKALMHLVCGTVLAIFILRPLSNINLEDLLYFPLLDEGTAEHCITKGEKIAAEAQAEYIKASCEAYILDKAKRLGAEITAQVLLDENLIPQSADIEGSLDPDIQIQLQNILSDDLGIPKENQIWTWNQGSNRS